MLPYIAGQEEINRNEFLVGHYFPSAFTERQKSARETVVLSDWSSSAGHIFTDCNKTPNKYLYLHHLLCVMFLWFCFFFSKSSPIMPTINAFKLPILEVCPMTVFKVIT